MNFLRNAFINNRLLYQKVMKRIMSNYTNLQIISAYTLTWTSIFIFYIVGKKIVYRRHYEEINEFYKNLNEKMLDVLIKSNNIIDFSNIKDKSSLQQIESIKNFLEKNSIKNDKNTEIIKNIFTILNFVSKNLKRNQVGIKDSSFMNDEMNAERIQFDEVQDVIVYMIDNKKFSNEKLKNVLKIKLPNIVITDKIIEYDTETLIFFYTISYFRSLLIEKYLTRQDNLVKQTLLELTNKIYSCKKSDSSFPYLISIDFLKANNNETIESIIDSYLNYKNNMKLNPFDYKSLTEKIDKSLINKKETKEIIDKFEKQSDKLIMKYEFQSVELALNLLKCINYKIKDIKNMSRAMNIAFESNEFRDQYTNIENKLKLEEVLLNYYENYNEVIIDENKLSREKIDEISKVFNSCFKRLAFNDLKI